ncbi:MAG: aminotransferase class I and II, partial [Sphingobacteriales bacterium 24-40-4]
AVNSIDDHLASKIVWLDALLMNMDRTCRNTNMLIWHKELWLIDHGASLYFHHSWQNWEEQAEKPFTLIKDHVLLAHATQLELVDKQLKTLLSGERIKEIVSLIPDEWLEDTTFQSTEEHRNAYISFLERRINKSEIFVNEALNAREILI